MLIPNQNRHFFKKIESNWNGGIIRKCFLFKSLNIIFVVFFSFCLSFHPRAREAKKPLNSFKPCLVNLLKTMDKQQDFMKFFTRSTALRSVNFFLILHNVITYN